jgi:hypothetical protein
LDHISQIDPNAKLHLTGRRKLGISFRKLSLDLYRTVYGIHDTAKLSQKVISWGIYYSAFVVLDEGGHGRSIASECPNGATLILAHEAAILFDIGTQDGTELSCGDFVIHGSTSFEVLQ